MPFEIIRNDITKLQVDAIVNASDTKLKKGGGVSGDIFAAAGAEALQKACDAIGHCGIGEAAITGGFGLSAKYIIHAAGPVLEGRAKREDLIVNLNESFSQMLLCLIDEKGMTDVQAYKKAYIDRKLFSKIRSNAGYNSSKAAAIALAIALELNLDQSSLGA